MDVGIPTDCMPGGRSGASDDRRIAWAPVSVQEARVAKRTSNMPEGRSRQSNKGEGNCLPNAVVQGLSELKVREQNVEGSYVRQEVANELERDDKYKSFWDGEFPNGIASKGTFDDYKREIAKDGKWMGCLELAAAAENLR